MIWLKNKENEDAPNVWINSDDKEDECKTSQNLEEDNLERIKKIEKFADILISTSPDDMCCEKHKEISNQERSLLSCITCNELIEKAKKYQQHYHTFTCAKKKKTMTINENKGHGRLDGIIKDQEMKNISLCRFKFPKFPLDDKVNNWYIKRY